MPRRPDLPCAGNCGKLLWRSTTSLPVGQAMCRTCRAIRQQNKPTPPQQLREWDCIVCHTHVIATSTRSTNGTKCPKHRKWKRTNCSWCADTMYSVNTQKKHRNVYCSDECRGAAKQERINAKQERLDANPPMTTLEWKQCHCGCWICKPGKKYCDDQCTKAKQRSDYWDIRPPRQCKACPASILNLPSVRRLCDACRDGNILEQRRNQRRTPRHKAQKHHRNRAKYYGVEYEPIDPLRVYARDGWRCGICTRRVDKRLKYPNPMSASLDHIIAMSNGGGHTYINVQCSHWICNVLKSNRQTGDQLALIG